jgi:hypothetical protein
VTVPPPELPEKSPPVEVEDSVTLVDDELVAALLYWSSIATVKGDVIEPLPGAMNGLEVKAR